MSIQEILFLPVAAAMRHVGKHITEPVRLSGAFDEHLKHDNSLVTIADTQAQDYLTQQFSRLVTDAKVLGEESFGKDVRWQDSPLLRDKGAVFVVDPIDGTRRFARGEDYGVMVALREQGAVRAAWVYYPKDDAMYFASQKDPTIHVQWSGRDAHTVMPVAIPAALGQSMTLREYSKSRATAGDLGPYDALRLDFAQIERGMCIATEMRDILQTGRYANLADFNTPWDRAPVAYLVERAGAPPVVDFNGRVATDTSSGFILAPTRAVQEKILAVTRRGDLTT